MNSKLAHTTRHQVSGTDLRREKGQLHQTKEVSHVLGAFLQVILEPHHQGLMEEEEGHSFISHHILFPPGFDD